MENKYKIWYNSIISNAKKRTIDPNIYVETHHIIPRSIGGDDHPDNLVTLTAREHFICHILLAKFTTGIDKNKMVRAVILMKGHNKTQHRYFNSRLYETAKVLYSVIQGQRMTGEKNSFYGKKHSEEVKFKMSIAKKGKHNNSWNTGLTKDTSEKLKSVGLNISKSKKGKPSPKKGIPGPQASEEVKNKMKETRKGTSYWWNNGETNVRAASSPGLEWKRGRLMSPSLYSSFCKKINDKKCR